MKRCLAIHTKKRVQCCEYLRHSGMHRWGYVYWQSRKNNKLKKYRLDYKKKHGHYPENHKVKITCLVCHAEQDKIWNNIIGKRKET